MELTPTTIAGYRTLNGRYALLECMAISSVGKIYRGRDLQQVQSRGMDSRILVHLLPDGIDTPMEALFQHINKTHQQAANSWIIAPRTYGQDGDTHYIVLESPNERHLSSLTLDSHPEAYRHANQQQYTLKKQGYISKQVDPALLLSSPEQQVYWLSTALSPAVQALQTTFLPLPSAKRTVMKSAFIGAGLLTLTAISAIAGNYINSTDTDTVLVTQAAAPASVEQPVLQLAMITPEVPAYVTARSNSDRMMQSYQEPPLSSPLAEAEPVEPAAATSLAKPLLIPTASAKTPKVKTVVLRPVPKPEQPKPKVTPKLDKPHTNTAITAAPSAEAVVETPAQPAILGIDELTTRANAALAADQLDDAHQYADAIKAQAHLHPQVKRLGDAIIARYHQRARTALAEGNATQAQRLLGASKEAIIDFNLTNANPGQEVLEHKIAAFQ
jgi:hypothetical protein